MVVFGSGSAGAVNEYVGATYEKAAGNISNAGRTAVIATRIGEYLPTEKCIVTGSRYGSGGKVLLDLNCNDPETAGHAGYSVMTPQGKRAQALRQQGEDLSNGYAKAIAAGKTPWCMDNVERCQKACEQSGNCSEELLQALGM
jgi:hypothetical protein